MSIIETMALAAFVENKANRGMASFEELAWSKLLQTEREFYLRDIRAALAAAEAAGYVMVPKEPTGTMLHSGFGTADDDNTWRWQAMLASRPSLT